MSSTHFVFIFSSRCIDFIVFGGDRLINLPLLKRLKKAVSWNLDLDEPSCLLWSARVLVGSVIWDLNLDESSCVLRDVPRVVGSDGTVSIVKIVSLSPRVENLKVKKVIKVSYLNQESCQCFVFFGIPMHLNILALYYSLILFGLV